MRYFSLRSDTAHMFGDDPVYLPNLSVEGSGPVKTGLLDHRGDPIYRAAEPIGFITQFKPRIRVKAARGE